MDEGRCVAHWDGSRPLGAHDSPNASSASLNTECSSVNNVSESGEKKGSDGPKGGHGIIQEEVLPRFLKMSSWEEESSAAIQCCRCDSISFPNYDYFLFLFSSCMSSCVSLASHLSYFMNGPLHPFRLEHS
ncbi:hypothetical protein C8R41DRAFT_369014 [Lentinula lateritia]|uniref:Uncharacterized protein n=1 Tax=Lentinula lateritia TaxID=40482 RepID=A0ABQ8VEW0_9AGAR|nr:hypothetical protein C8R41DRAFT_369014 [Lentinula lateritia]